MVGIFYTDLDRLAVLKTRRYIETGLFAEGAVTPGATDGERDTDAAPPEGDGAGGGTPAPSGDPAEVRRRLDDVIRRQRELLREVERLREAVGAEGGG